MSSHPLAGAAAAASKDRPVPEKLQPTHTKTLRWAGFRTALSVFAIGWVLLPLSSGLLLTLFQFRADLDLTWGQLLGLLLSAAQGMGIVYFATGMAMSCGVPPESRARVRAWVAFGCLVAGAVAYVLFLAAQFHNRVVVLDIQQRISTTAAKNPKAGPPGKGDLERELRERAWPLDVLRTLSFAALAGLLCAKILLSDMLRMVARYFRRIALARGLLIYLFAEVAGALAAVSLWSRQQTARGNEASLFILTTNGYAVGITGVYCAAFVVCLFLVRRTVTRALLGQSPG